MDHKSEYTKGNTVIAFNQSNYPVLIEIYEIGEDYVKFASNISNKVIISKTRYEGKTDRFYFMHFGVRYYFDETMTVF